MSDLRITMLGGPLVEERFEKVAAAARDMRPAWDELKDRFVAAEVATFAAQGGASGRWQALSPGYAAEKAVRYPGKSMMRATDTLYRSLTSHLDIDIRTESTMVLGSDVPYGTFHQEGRGHLPVRRLIDLSEAELASWVDVVGAHLVGGRQADPGVAA